MKKIFLSLGVLFFIVFFVSGTQAYRDYHACSDMNKTVFLDGECGWEYEAARLYDFSQKQSRGGTDEYRLKKFKSNIDRKLETESTQIYEMYERLQRVTPDYPSDKTYTYTELYRFRNYLVYSLYGGEMPICPDDNDYSTRHHYIDGECVDIMYRESFFKDELAQIQENISDQSEIYEQMKKIVDSQNLSKSILKIVYESLMYRNNTISDDTEQFFKRYLYGGTVETTDSIVCPDGFVMQGEECIPEASLELQVEVIEGSNPMPANGGVLVLKMNLLNLKTRQNIADPAIVVDYTTLSQKGFMRLKQDLGNGVFLMEYHAPALLEESGKDIIYAKYQDENGETKYDTYEVILSAPTEIQISKPGFQPQTTKIGFSGPKTKVKIITLGVNDAEIPVAGVELTHNEYFTVFTDANGEALVENPNETNSTDIAEVKIILQLEDRAVEARKDAYRVYTEMLQNGNISENISLEKFMTDYIKYLSAETNELQSRKIASAIKRLPTSLGIIKQGIGISQQAGGEIAEAWTNLGSDFKSMLSSLTKFDEYLENLKKKADETFKYSERLKSLAEKLTAKIKPISENLSKKLAEAQKKGEERLGVTVMQELVNGVKEEFVEDALGKYQAYIILKAGKADPENLEKLAEEVKNKLLGENFVQDTFQNWVKDYYKTQQKTLNDEVLKTISQNLEKGNYPDYSADDMGIENARSNYSNFVGGSYNLKNEQQYRISRFKDGIDYVNSIITFEAAGTGVLSGVKENELIKNTIKVFEGVEKAFKTFKVVIDGVLVYHRYDAFYMNQDAVKQSSLRAMDIHKVAYSPSDEVRSLFNSVYAEDEIDLLKQAYEADLQDPDKNILLEFTQASIDQDFYGILYTLSQTMAEEIPNDTEVQQIVSNFKSELDLAQNSYDNLIQTVAEMDINTNSNSGNSGFLGFALFILGFLLLMIFLFRKRRFRKVLFIILFSLSAIFFALLFRAGDGSDTVSDLNDSNNSNSEIETTVVYPDGDTEFSRTEDTFYDSAVIYCEDQGGIVDETGENCIVNGKSYEIFDYFIGIAHSDEEILGQFKNEKYSFVLDFGHLKGQVTEFRADERFGDSFVYCIPNPDPNYLDNACGKGNFTLFFIDIYPEDLYQSEIESSPYEEMYQVLGEKDGNYFIFSHLNGYIPFLILETLDPLTIDGIGESFSLR